MRLEGKVALITGGASGMGAAEAKLFASEGAKVAIGDILEEEGRRVAGEIGETGGQAMFLRLDVTREEEWQRAVQAVAMRFGKLDVLVNNAGLSSSSVADRLSTEGWDTIMDVNAKGVFLGTKYAIPEMRRAGGGAIVNISSIMGMVGGHGHPAYNASKGAVRLLTKVTAVQYAREGIRCNSVHPGFMPPMRSAREGDLARTQANIEATPMGRRGRVEEVAYGVLFLASDEASYITGAELVIDGGFTAQ